MSIDIQEQQIDKTITFLDDGLKPICWAIIILSALYFIPIILFP